MTPALTRPEFGNLKFSFESYFCENFNTSMILSILLLVACLVYVLVVRLRPGKLFTVAIHRLFLQQRVRLKIHRNCVNRIEVQGASIRCLHFLTSVAFIFSFMCFFNREIMQHVDNNITWRQISFNIT